MKNISLNIDKVLGTVSKKQILDQETKANNCIATLHNGDGIGNDFLGWLHLPSSITDEELTDIENTTNILREKCEVVVAVGIGGSYLGTKAVVDALNNSFDFLLKERKNPILLYAGQNIGEDYLYELTEILKDKQFGIINISKSGTTTEPALAFRILKKQLEDAVGKEEAKTRIVAITDKSKGALRTLATKEGYKTFIIPDNVGGRFSVLTPVGLLPIAVAGISIRELVAGAVSMEKRQESKFLSKKIFRLYMQLFATNYIRAVRVSKYWQISIQNFIILVNGGNSFTEKAKEKTTRVSSCSSRSHHRSSFYGAVDSGRRTYHL